LRRAGTVSLAVLDLTPFVRIIPGVSWGAAAQPVGADSIPTTGNVATKIFAMTVQTRKARGTTLRRNTFAVTLSTINQIFWSSEALSERISKWVLLLATTVKVSQEVYANCVLPTCVRLTLIDISTATVWVSTYFKLKMNNTLTYVKAFCYSVLILI
jgi:hypothetical protein